MAPAGQQPSPATCATVAFTMQAAAQVFADTSWAWKHGVPDTATQSSSAGQAPGAPAAIMVSQVSPGSTTPSPHFDEQSGSSAGVASAGQQPSPGTRSVISVWVHDT